MASGIVGIGPTWLDRRQMGFRNPMGTKSRIYEQMYSNILPYNSWDPTTNNTYTSVHGGIFSLEFSPEGSLLVAACEKRSVLMFDPLTHKRIHSLENAHLDCVNCVRFLDSKSFATCSDDHTVVLWDARNLNHKVRLLKGHSNWVKNIEYSPQDGLLVTSGFDGSILTWEVNTYKEDSIVPNKVFSTNGLMRMRLTPDATKMVLCTTGGYIIIVHNLDLNLMSQDLIGFKPNMYRLMQLSQTIIPVASDFAHLFRSPGKRNRIEFITDFPEGDDAEVISSLQIHPDGHCAISRNVSSNEKSEWSCIHNIEERLSSDESDFTDEDAEGVDESKIIGWSQTSPSISTTPSCIIQHTVVEHERRLSTGARTNATATGAEQNDLSVTPSDVWEALVAIHEARNRRELEETEREMSVGQMFRRQAMDSEVRNPRPVNFDSQIFVTRILPNLNADRVNEPQSGPGRLRPCGSAFRHGLCSNAVERSMPNRTTSRRNWTRFVGHRTTPNGTKKFGVRRRYFSLYRRSLVGQYDRTSVLRKPIYNRGVMEYKYKKYVKLNTNYEINETRRLLGAAAVSPKLTRGSDLVLNRRQVHRGLIRNFSRTNSDLKNNAGIRHQCVDSVSENRVQGNSVIANRNILEDVQTSPIVGNENEEHDDDDDDDGIEIKQQKMRNSKSCVVEEGVPGSAAVMMTSTFRQEETNGIVDHEEIIEAESSGSFVERQKRQTSGSLVSPTETSTKRCDIPVAKTILMGVFRAGNDGLRGTSMRKHNVAAVTVSSSGSPGKVEGNLSLDQHNTKTRKQQSMDVKFKKKHRSGLACAESSTSRRGEDDVSSFQPYSTVSVNKKIHQNTKRLTHFVEEPNLGRGFIKELCVSPDGRIICSPFGNGIRLLSFSPSVQDVFHCYPSSPPVPLHELTLNIAHTDIVVSTKFSPFHNLLVSGCLSGKIIYYQPFL